MSENNLQARNRYIAKIQKKADELAQSIRLLTQVDDKLFKQSGGGLAGLGVNIADLEVRAEAWKKAIDSTKGLDDTIKALKDNIDAYQNRVKNLLTGAVPQEFKSTALEELLSLDNTLMGKVKNVFTLAATKPTDTTQLNTERDQLIAEINTLIDNKVTDTTVQTSLKTEVKKEIEDRVTALSS